MVAHTGNSTMTTASSTTLPTNSYLSPSFKMNLPQNLLHPIDSWTKADVQKWIEYCIDEYSLGDVNLNDFEMNGKALLLLNEENFKQRSARSGDILHKALQQHRTMLKSLHCQAYPYSLWNNFTFPSSTASSSRRLNLLPPPPPPPLSMSSFHPNAAGVLQHPAAAAAAAAACMHPAFMNMFNRPETIPKPSLVNNQRSNYYNANQHQSSRNREISTSSSSSSASSHCPDIASVKISSKSDMLHPVHESNGVKREANSPNMPQSNGHPTPNASPATTSLMAARNASPSIKQECQDDEDVDIEQHETVATPPITSSSPSCSSPRSSSSGLTKSNHLNNELIPSKIRSQLQARIKQQQQQQSNHAINVDDNNDEMDVNSLANDNTRQIRYYHDRIDFRGDILMKPPAAKNCRILWEFLYILLEDPHYESIIHWENREKMIFRIIQADKLAALWGLQKNRLSMTYEKLSRGMRYYYSNNIISKEQSKRLLYRFMRSPDEIRKSMKRNGGNTSMVYSSLNKKSTPSYPTSASPDDQEMNGKYSPEHDDNSSSSSHFTAQSSSQIQHQLLQLFSIYSPANTAITSDMNSANALLLATRNATNHSSSTPSNMTTSSKPSGTFLGNISKSDRSNSSSPESFDSSRDRTSDSEKQHCSPSQSLSSSTSTSSYSTSTKRKQAVPLSLTARLSYHQHQHDQPLNLAVHKDENIITDCKKQKVSPSPSVV